MADDVIAALQTSDLFGSLPLKRLQAIRDAGREVSFPRGTEIVSQGDDAGRLYLIVEGTVDVSSGGSHRNTLGPGGAVGELALIDGGPRSATVTATSDVRAFSLASWNFHPFMSELDVVTAVVKLLCRRLRDAEASLHS